ncbi:MAG: NAD-dependent epimerase/dehydratase family protein [Candidatus Latescibacteria bacterium]|nr:NAD-dependent epimerase/dehydratase family protein [bacterium]MBD3425058.1 NAD-dependent epimerase/dehydratase family protein [Candidatus Latescibacterota bacterium]
MRVLITGAYGFVGRYMAREMAEAGYPVLATDIVSPEKAEGIFPEGTEYFQCDLLDLSELERLISDAAPDLVVHLAAQSSGRVSISRPAETFRVNIFGFINLLEVLRKIGNNPRVLAVGSGEEYGRKKSPDMPLKEDAAIDPANPYAASKASQTIIAMQYQRTYGLDILGTRSFNHTGPGQSELFVFPSFAKKCAGIAYGGNEPLLKTGNLEIIRDFLDVRDVVRAYRILSEEGKPGRVYNVCSGEGLKLKEGLDIIIEQFDIEVEIDKDPELFRPADVPVFIGDNSRLSGETGWKRIISAEKMLSALADYWKSRYSR